MPEPQFVKNLHLLPDQPIVCLHHTDMDGVFSAIILKLYFRQVFFIGVNYGKPIAYSMIPMNSIVFLVDFTPKPIDMKRLAATNTLIYIDHHITYDKEEYKEFSTLEGIRSTECAGCKLVWRYMFPDQPAPRAVNMISDYDTWNFTNPDTLPFLYSMELLNINARSISDVKLRKIMYNDEYVNSQISMGKRIDVYIKKRNELLSNDGAFLTEINGHKVIAMNIRNVNSMVLDAAAAKHPDVKLRSTFGFNSSIGKFKCSLYSDTTELTCQSVDSRFEGHPTAAGMECDFDQLPYKVPSPDLNKPNSPDFVSELVKMASEDELIGKHDSASLGYLCKLNGYPAIFEGLSTFAVNHPYWTSKAMYNTDLITDYEIVLFWNLTSSGWYRYRIYPLEKNRKSLEELVKWIPGSKIVGAAVWCYRDKILTSNIPINPNEYKPFMRKQ